MFATAVLRTRSRTDLNVLLPLWHAFVLQSESQRKAASEYGVAVQKCGKNHVRIFFVFREGSSFSDSLLRSVNDEGASVR